MRLNEIADPEVYSLSRHDAADLLQQIERMFPDGLPDEAGLVVVRRTKPRRTKRQILFDAP